MGCTSRAHSAEITKSTPPRQRGGPPRAAWAAGLVLLALVLSGLSAPAAQAQSCAGKAAGDVCRPSAGGCDVAETCVPAGGNPGAALYSPADGSLGTDVPWNYNMGYGFTPNKTITVTSLGGFFNGTRTVYLYDRTTGAVLASASVTAANGWAYAPIAPVTLNKTTPYSVAVYLPGTGGAYRASMTSMPSVAADATIDGSCYRYANTAEPCASSGLLSGINYGMADIKYLQALPLYQPADGTLYTDVAGDYTAGYAFTPNKSLTLTHLGGLYDGTRTVYLYDRSTGAVLASASNTSANSYAYTQITPITLVAGKSYTVAVYTAGSGGSYRPGLTSMPSVLADATIEGTCYRPSSTAEPCASSGLISGTNYGMADIKYSATGGGLACPADSFLSAGSVCRAATGSCDVAETCTGSSAACPANAFVAAGVSCNDGQLCTYNDVCNGAGSCGGTAITCGGGNACSTTVCNGTSTCDVSKVFCDDPPGECYNTLGSCNTANGSCSYTVKVGAPCGVRGTCQSSGGVGVCYTPPAIVDTGTPDCTTPAPTPIGCESCDASKPCVIDSTATLPAEWRTCSGYTPRKGDVVVHEAAGLTHELVSQWTNLTHIGVFMGPQQGSDAQLVRHQALNLDGLGATVIQAGKLQSALIALSLNKSSAYCKSAKLDPANLFDPGQFIPGVPNTHTADMLTELDETGALYWENGVSKTQVFVAANRTLGEDVANRMAARDDYYSLNSLVDEAKGRATLSHGKPGTNCASAIMSCVTPEVPRTLLEAIKIKAVAEGAYEKIRRLVRHMPETENAVTTCKNYFCLGGLLCPVDCNGLAWETANGIADQIIACFLFGPTGAGCDCTRDNRKWHFAAWGGTPPSLTQDESDWANHRMTDVEFALDTWTPAAAAGQAVTNIYDSYSYLPSDIAKSGNYPHSYDLEKKYNVTRQYGHCQAPQPVYEGNDEATNCRSVSGWAWDQGAPNSSINVDVYRDGSLAATIPANLYRGDLYSAGKGNGYHAFVYTPPGSWQDGQGHSIHVRYAGTSTELPGSPRSVACGVSMLSSLSPQDPNLTTGGQVYTVATQFSSSVGGYVTQLGFYRAPSESGSNTLRLWTDNGVQLASVTTYCSGGGWCWGDIYPDVAIAAGTVYRVTVNTNSAQAKTGCGIGGGITNQSLTALSGFWQAGDTFPTTGSCSDFFVDVKFDM